jgi:single-strand DNA-binding protein
MATNETWIDDKKQKQTRTDWHLVEVWGAAAKLAGEYLAKGRLVLVEGSSRTDKYEKDGQTHWRTKVVARNIQFLDRPEKQESIAGEEAPEPSTPSDVPPF